MPASVAGETVKRATKRAAAANTAAKAPPRSGPFQPFFLKPFPVRAAFEVGTGGLVSVAVARVDAAKGAIRDHLWHSQLPLTLKPFPGTALVDAASKEDVVSKVSLLQAALRTNVKGTTELAGLLTWPFSAAPNGTEVAAELTRRLQIPFRVAPSPDADPKFLPRLVFDAYVAATQTLDASNFMAVCEVPPTEGVGIDLIAQQGPADAGAAVVGEERDGRERPFDPAFPAPRAARGAETSTTALIDVSAPPTLLRVRLPVSTALAHRVLVAEVQRRAAAYRPTMSPNPVLRGEWIATRDALQRMVAAALPPWATARSARGCVIAGASPNGGLLNIAARISGKQQLPLDALEVQTEFHYCGQTDVLIGENYPNPHLVLPQAALASALMRALRTHRLHYISEISCAHALLVAPQFWARADPAGLEARVRSENPELMRQRRFAFPHQVWHRADPNGPAEAGFRYQTFQPAREPGTGAI